MGRFDDIFYIEDRSWITTGETIYLIFGKSRDERLVRIDDEYCTWSDFFIGGRRNSLICEAMLDLYEKYLSKHKDILIYFLIDDFLMLLKLADVEDGALKRLSIYESSPFYIADHFKDELSKNNLDMVYSVPQKIDRRENYDNDNPNSIYNLVVLNGLSYEDAQKHCSM